MRLSKAQQDTIGYLRERKGWLTWEPISNYWQLWYLDRDGGFLPCTCRRIDPRTAQRLLDLGLIECNREKYGDSNYRLTESES